MIPARAFARSLAESLSRTLWLLRYRIEESRQAVRSGAKRAIVRAVLAASDFGTWLIHVLGLEDA